MIQFDYWTNIVRMGWNHHLDFGDTILYGRFSMDESYGWFTTREVVESKQNFDPKMVSSESLIFSATKNFQGWVIKWYKIWVGGSNLMQIYG